MTRQECLDAAAKAVLKDRAREYGDGPEDSFSAIAGMWSAYLGRPVSSADVACMMALLKIARLKANPHHGDSWVDVAGYAACGAECVSGTEAPSLKLEEIPPQPQAPVPDPVKAVQSVLSGGFHSVTWGPRPEINPFEYHGIPPKTM